MPNTVWESGNFIMESEWEARLSVDIVLKANGNQHGQHGSIFMQIIIQFNMLN